MIHIVIIHNQVISCTCIYYMLLCCTEKLLIFAHIYADLMSWMLPEDLEIDKHSVRHV